MRSGWRLTTPAVLFINVGLARGNTKAANTVSACFLHQNHHRQMHLHAHPRMYSSGLCRGETKSACTSVATSQDAVRSAPLYGSDPLLSHAPSNILSLPQLSPFVKSTENRLCARRWARRSQLARWTLRLKTAGRTHPVLEIRAVQKRKRM